MKTYTVENISGYLDTVNAIKIEWDEVDLWYRGVSDSSFKLIPSLYRGKFKIDLDEEEEVYGQFVRKAKAFIGDYNKLKPIDWYILMQHYDFPTRLLDWSSGSLIALYFAVRNSFSQSNRCIYIIDPFDINKTFHETETIPCSDDCLIKDYQLINAYLPNPRLAEYPIAIEPPFIDKRIVAQKSCFTIHGTNRQSFEQLFENRNVKVAKIEINNDDVVQIKEELFSAGISESIIFPDLEGLARELIFQYVIE